MRFRTSPGLTWIPDVACDGDLGARGRGDVPRALRRRSWAREALRLLPLLAADETTNIAWSSLSFRSKCISFY